MPAPKRRQLREAVVQYLYFWEVTRPAPEDLARSMELIWEAFEVPAEGRDFSEALILGTIQNIEKIDGTIKEKLENWDFSRLHKVDLTILRLALYEFYFRTDIPPVVTINEAIDLAKGFSGDESGKFINGILDKIAPTLGRSLREAQK